MQLCAPHSLAHKVAERAKLRTRVSLVGSYATASIKQVHQACVGFGVLDQTAGHARSAMSAPKPKSALLCLHGIGPLRSPMKFSRVGFRSSASHMPPAVLQRAAFLLHRSASRFALPIVGRPGVLTQVARFRWHLPPHATCSIRGLSSDEV